MTPQVRTPVVRMKPSHNILSFGINGSLRRREVSNPQPYTEYYLFNSAANLKAYSNNGLDFAYYGYNGTLPKYAFNAKELDEETGMYYYEARYYKPPVFTSRDPMFEKYFWMTPYAYCANNPVKYVDPSGREIDIALEKRKDKDEPVGQVVVYKNGQLYNKNADGTIGDLYTGNTEKKQFCTDRPPIVGLAHELGHAFYFNNGTVPIQRNADGIDEINKSAFENLAIVIENIARRTYGLKERPLMK